MDFRARVMTGFWPAIVRHVAHRAIQLLGVAAGLTGLPTPILITILSSLGTCMMFL